MNYCWLTTKDNPFDPFSQFKEWFLYDVKNGYNTCGLIDRIAITSDELSEAENNREIERAIDEILTNVDFMKDYKKVYSTS